MHFRRGRWLVVVTVALPSLGFAILSRSGLTTTGEQPLTADSTASTVCAEVAAWMKVHRSALPTTLEELSRYPLPYRRAIYHELPARIRKELWAAHLGKYLAVRSLLTAEQVALILEVRDHLDPYLDKTKGEAARQALHDRAIKVMGFDLARDIFATLGPPDATEASGVPAFTRLRHSPSANSHATLVSVRAYGVIMPAIRISGIACSCTRQSDWCRNGYACVDGGCDVGGSCGTLWLYDCTGLCESPNGT